MTMLTLLLGLLLSPRAPAQSLEERVGAIERIFAPVDPEYRYGGLGPVASKVYRGEDLGARFGLTSEFFTLGTGLETSADNTADAHSNVLSVAPTLAYRPHERLYFNAQVNFANGGAETSETVALRRGGAVVRFAYLDWTFAKNSASGVRLGHQLIPIGRTNTDVDGLTYFGVRRPPVERDLIPADWHENGVLAYWNKERVTAEVGFFNSLDARDLRGETFLAGGVSGGQNAPTSDVMMVGRVNGLFGAASLGGSFAAGGTAQGNDALPGGAFRLAEAHARYRRPRLVIEGQVARGQLDDANLIGLLNQTSLASIATGATLSVGARLLPVGRPALWAFARAARVNLNAEMPSGFLANARLDRREAQLGVHYLPLPTLVLKADATRVRYGDDSGHAEFWLGAGFVY